MKIAPVFIGTLDRHTHFQKAVDSLKENQFATDTHLFIGLDYPSQPKHYPGYDQICKYLDNLTGFKDITIMKRTKNYGAIRNFQEGKTEVLKHHDRIIVSEDDNCFSQNFLSFINQGLERFKDEQRVFAICGHNYPVSFDNRYDGNHFAWQGCSVWGYGIWKERYQSMNCKQIDFVKTLNVPRKVVQAYRIAPHYVSSMLAKVNTRNEYDPFSDAAINLYLRSNGLFCIFPTLSKVRNFGHDGSGLHSGEIKGISPFANQTIDDSDSFVYDCSEEIFFNNPKVNKMLFRYFYRGRIQTLKTISRLIRFYFKRKLNS